jgi:GTPase SAR1 family protein
MEKKITGFVFPLGNGAVGKTSIALTMNRDSSRLMNLTKSRNLEFEYVSDQVLIGDDSYTVQQQYLILPGQKEMDGDNTGRSFETVLGLYRFMIRRVDVVLLTYDITSLDSFYDLEFWTEKASDLIHNKTEYILVGTHLDLQEKREVTQDVVNSGIDFICERTRQNKPEWAGECFAIEVSNTSMQNQEYLKSLVSYAILYSQNEVMQVQPLYDHLTV